MSVFICVVSHGHGNVIRELNCLVELANYHNVVVKFNKSEPELRSYLLEHGVDFIDSNYMNGFGANNNIVFEYCVNSKGMNQDDFFIVLNPDVFIAAHQVNSLVEKMKCNGVKFACANLYRSFDFDVYDNSIRRFPSVFDFLSSFMGCNRTIINKDEIDSPCSVDWAAGSFLAFTASHYTSLCGFDESYFMYCEDVDICYRSKMLGIDLVYFPDIKMVHLASHSNRNFFSRHFVWHVKSALLFSMRRLGVLRNG